MRGVHGPTRGYRPRRPRRSISFVAETVAETGTPPRAIGEVFADGSYRIRAEWQTYEPDKRANVLDCSV